MENLVSRLDFYLTGMENSRSSESKFEDYCINVSKVLDKLLSDLKSGTRFISLTWVQNCLEMLRKLNAAFEKLVVEIDHPMIQWDGLIEGYFNYTLNLLDLLNSISYSVSQLRHAWLCASHALTLLQSGEEVADRLREIRFCHLYKQFAIQELKEKHDQFSCQGNEQVIQRALVTVRGIGYWVCGIILSSLSGDSSPYQEMRKSVIWLDFPAIAAIDAIVVKERGLASEIREVGFLMVQIVDEAVDGSEMAAEELKKKLEEINNLLDGIGKEEEGTFSEIMYERNKLMECLRLQI